MSMRTRRFVAIGAAFVALLCTGTLLRWVRVSRATEAMVYTPPARPLSLLPKQIGRYTFVRDLPLAGTVLDAAGVDHFLQRDYIDSESGEHLLLYVGYWGRENRGMGHGPEVCYPAVGWTAESEASESTLRFRPPDTSMPTVMALHRFVRSEPEGTERRTVGFLTIASGEYRASSRSVFWHRPGALRGGGHYLAQIQVSRSVTSETGKQEESDIVAFMEAFLPYLSECLPPIGRQAT